MDGKGVRWWFLSLTPSRPFSFFTHTHTHTHTALAPRHARTLPPRVSFIFYLLNPSAPEAADQATPPAARSEAVPPGR